MFTQYSIRQLMIATAGVAIVVSIVAVGIQQDNLMGWGAVVSVALLPVLFLVFGLVVMLANVFCNSGTSFFGPLEKSPSPSSLAIAGQDPQKKDEQPAADVSLTKAADATKATKATESTKASKASKASKAIEAIDEA